MADKLPAMPFYTGDWRKDPGVQALDYYLRGVWFEMLCIMWESEERGRLVLNGRPMPLEALANLLGLDKVRVKQILTKLVDEYGVAKVEEETSIVYSKRMVEDERLREIRRRCGQKGGNPNLVKLGVNQKPTTKDKQQPKQKPTLSISSSISSSIKDLKTLKGGKSPSSQDKSVDNFTCPLRERDKSFITPYLKRIKEMVGKKGLGQVEADGYVKAAWIGCIYTRQRWFHDCNEEKFKKCQQFIDFCLKSFEDQVKAGHIRGWQPAYLSGVVEAEINNNGEDWFKVLSLKGAD